VKQPAALATATHRSPNDRAFAGEQIVRRAAMLLIDPSGWHDGLVVEITAGSALKLSDTRALRELGADLRRRILGLLSGYSSHAFAHHCLSKLRTLRFS